MTKGLIDMTDSPHLTERDHSDAGKWLFGYLLCLRDLGRISVEEFEAWASEPRRRALADKLEE